MPRTLEPGQPAQLTFAIHDPWKGRPVTNFQLVHEKLFHMFVVSQDLEFFVHNHPVFQPDGSFRYDNLKLPKAGMYRVLGDFYPDGATPQLIAKTMIVPGTPPAPVHLSRDYSTERRRQHAGGFQDRSAASHRRPEDPASFHHQADGLKSTWAPGAHARGQ